MDKVRSLPQRGPKMGPKEPINMNTVKRLLSYVFKDYKFLFLIVVICIIASSIAQVTGQLFMRSLIDDHIIPLIGSKNPVYTGLIKTLTLMATIYVVGIISSYVQNRIMIKISQGTMKKIRNDMFRHLQTLPIRYFDTNSHGDVMSRFTNDTNTLRQMIAQSLPQCISSLATIISILCSMLYLNFILTIIVMLCVFVMINVSKTITKKASKYFVSQQESIGNLNGYIEELVDGVKVVKVFNYEDRSKLRFDELNEKLCNDVTNANKFANTLMPIMHNIGNINYVIIAIIGSLIAINTDSITVGTIVSFLALTRSFTMPINQVSQQINSIIMALAGANRIFELLDSKSEENDGKITLVNVKREKDMLIEVPNYTGIWAWKNPDKKELTLLQGDVRFFDVSFGYTDKKVLHDINLYAKPGQKIAFVGSTGAGKTTITNLINRFYDVDSGKITYDGIDVRDINKKDLRLSLGIVLQDVNLFTGTILDNIKYGKKNATLEECIEAAKLANADEFIKLLPDGYNTFITNNGSNLSQGQRQLLAIARTAVANPPVMILDEATSSIDTRTEKIIQEGMDKLMQNRTVFVIAHRLSTVRNSNSIMVLEKGRIIERGDHDDLLVKKGKYYQLYTGDTELD